MLRAIAASPHGSETKERALLKVAPYLSSDQLRDMLLGRGPAGAAQCARTLSQYLETSRQDIWLEPVVNKIQHDAVRSAGMKVIDRHGRLNHNNRYAKDLAPALADLAILELVRLKLARLPDMIKAIIGR